MSKKGEAARGDFPPELIEHVEKLLLVEQMGKEPGYLFKLLEMDRAALEKEVQRLEEATKHYTAASGDELDAHWPASEKRKASENVQRLRMASKILDRFDEFSAVVQEFRGKINLQ